MELGAAGTPGATGPLEIAGGFGGTEVTVGVVKEGLGVVGAAGGVGVRAGLGTGV